MVKKRLIFTLLMQNGTFMLSRNFSLQSVGDLSWIREYYNFDAIAFSIDELIVLNVEREKRDIEQFSKNIVQLNKRYFMPVAAGGGIRSLDDAYLLLDSGVDKLVVNTTLLTQPELVTLLARTFGSQCIVASIDYKKLNGHTQVFISNGSQSTGLTVEDAVKKAEELGCGEIYLTSMDKDGTGQGFDLEMIHRIVELTELPVIASGGVGKYEHLANGVICGGANAVSTANLFNFIEDGLNEARLTMQNRGIDMAFWDIRLMDKLPNLVTKDDKKA
jgi:cyclase